jgi:hypothetical protein
MAGGCRTQSRQALRSRVMINSECLLNSDCLLTCFQRAYNLSCHVINIANLNPTRYNNSAFLRELQTNAATLPSKLNILVAYASGRECTTSTAISHEVGTSVLPIKRKMANSVLPIIMNWYNLSTASMYVHRPAPWPPASHCWRTHPPALGFGVPNPI